jgi:hypothetical protein
VESADRTRQRVVRYMCYRHATCIGLVSSKLCHELTMHACWWHCHHRITNSTCEHGQHDLPRDAKAGQCGSMPPTTHVPGGMHKAGGRADKGHEVAGGANAHTSPRLSGCSGSPSNDGMGPKDVEADGVPEQRGHAAESTSGVAQPGATCWSLDVLQRRMHRRHCLATDKAATQQGSNISSGRERGEARREGHALQSNSGGGKAGADVGGSRVEASGKEVAERKVSLSAREQHVKPVSKHVFSLVELQRKLKHA